MFRKEEELDHRDIALYSRVSTDEQAREGLSLDEQKHRIESYCLAMGWNQKIRHYVEDGYSAKNIDRPNLNSLINDVKNNLISKIIVTKLDRLSRKLKDLLILIDLFQEYKVSFISISESFDTNTPSGRLTLQVLGAVAEFERERIRERVVDNMFHAANHGQWLSSAPYGYNLFEKRLEVNEDASKVIKRIYDMYLNKGMGYLNIAKKLNDEGIPSPTNKQWWNRTIKMILTNPAYKGTTVWNRKEGSAKNRPDKDMEEWIIQEGTHPPIIEPNEWDKVQDKILSQKLPSRSQSSPNLLSGFLKCPRCGSGMSVSSSGSKNNPYKAYRCSAHKNKGSCVGTQYKVDVIHQAFLEGLKSLQTQLSSNPIAIIRKSNEHAETYSSTYQKLQTAKKRYQRKVEAYTAGLITLDDLKLEKNSLDDLALQLENKDNQDEILDMEELNTKINKIASFISLEQITNARTLLKDIVEKVTIEDDEVLRIHLK